MSDLIDRNAVLALAKDLCVPQADGTIYRHRCIDATSVMEIPKAVRKAKWVSTDLWPIYPPNSVCCTRCNGTVNAGYAEAYKYCPYCGARMEI